MGALRRRFILGAMLAFGILLVLLVGGIAVAGYVQMERSADVFLQRVMDEEKMEAAKHPPKPVFGYELPSRPSMSEYYVITTDRQGAILCMEQRGGWEADTELMEEYVAQIVNSGQENGKIGKYKYLLRWKTDEAAKLVLMDNAVQAHALADHLRTACLVSLLGAAVLFVILLPVSARVVRSYAMNIEKQKRFITDAGHELKTPVAIILSNVDAMDLIQGENKWSRNIRSQTARLSSLLGQLLLMARMDEQSVSMRTENVDLVSMIREEVETYQESMAKRGLSFEQRIEEIGILRGNRENLRQLIHILMDNAVQYADEGGKIELLLESRGRRARLVLRNSVESVPSCPPDALFDRFLRGDSARTQKSGGYGIGLSAAKSIVQNHHGKIEAAYGRGDSVRLTVELPLRRRRWSW